MPALDEDEQIEQVVRRLASVIELPTGEIERRVRAGFQRWEDASVREFIPIFVERHVRQELRQELGLTARSHFLGRVLAGDPA